MPIFHAQTVRLLGHSSVQTSHTGNTTDTTLATVTIPANAMGLNGRIRVSALWAYPNSANNKTCRIRFGGLGGTAIHSAINTTSALYRALVEVGNRNATNSQVCQSVTLNVGASGGTLVTAAVDTTAAVDVVITGQLALGSETITLETYLVELIS
jgi:hypothetical protein